MPLNHICDGGCLRPTKKFCLLSFILNFQKIKKLFFTVIYLLDISTLMVRGTQCNHTFFRWQFLRGETKNVTRGLKFLEFQKIKKKICWIITVFLGDNEGVGTMFSHTQATFRSPANLRLN